MNNYIRLSHIITNNAPSYGDRDKFRSIINSSITNGSSANTSKWNFTNNHIGTHIDVPRHFCDEGLRTFDYEVNNYIFNKVKLLDIPCKHAKLISINDIINAGHIDCDVELLLIRTGYENHRFKTKYWNDNPGIEPELADHIRKYLPKIRCIGFDFISLCSWKFREEGKQSHIEFLCPSKDKRSILIIEDMSLYKINDEIKCVIVAPIFIEDGNGGPVTVFAQTNL